jgi:hypothetical protein
LAVKGKSKSRGGRPRTNAPRPVVVVPKPPVLARRSIRFGILGVVVLTAATILLVVWNNEQDAKERRRQGEAIEEVNTKIELALDGIATPGAIGPNAVLPEFVAQVETLKTGTAKPADVEKAAKDLPKVLDGGVEKLEDLEVPEELRNTEYTIEVIDARESMVEALKAYRVGVALVQASLDLEGPARKAVLDQVTEQFALASRLFDNGRQKITNIRTDLGTFTGEDLAPQIPVGQ